MRLLSIKSIPECIAMRSLVLIDSVMFVFSRSLSQSLAEVATLVARSLYLQAGGQESELQNITADPKTVSHMTRDTHSHDLLCSTKLT